MNFKKISSKNNNFFWSKNDFEKTSWQFFLIFHHFPLVKNQLFGRKFENFKNFHIFHFKYFFRPEKNIIFRWFFLKVYLKIEENRFLGFLEPGDHAHCEHLVKSPCTPPWGWDFNNRLHITVYFFDHPKTMLLWSFQITKSPKSLKSPK